MATQPVLFARTGWMKRYKGPQSDDEKPIGGGDYNKDELGHEVFNFLPIGGRIYAYFQVQKVPSEKSKGREASVALQRIIPNFQGDVLKGATVIFVARNPSSGGQFIVGWYLDATVYRYSQPSSARERNRFKYRVETEQGNEVLVPEANRKQPIPLRNGGFGQSNICYALTREGKPKPGSKWVKDALEYVANYEQEDAAANPETEADPEIEEIIGSTIERSAGYQSNPLIRSRIEQYAMKLAQLHLERQELEPVDVHKHKSYDFLCKAGGADLYVEVKGTQESGRCISLTPKEVEHAKRHKNSALFIVHSVKVKGKKNPIVSGGQQLFIRQWDISKGTLEPRAYVFKLPESVFQKKKAAAQS